MRLAPLLAAPLWVQLHVVAALAAFVLGLAQMFRPKGDGTHRMLGYTWVALMLLVAMTSLTIRGIDHWRGWSAIHLLSFFTLAMLPLAVVHARRGRIGAHRKAMISLFAGALVIAGLFTLLPGRIMHAVVLGGP